MNRHLAPPSVGSCTPAATGPSPRPQPGVHPLYPYVIEADHVPGGQVDTEGVTAIKDPRELSPGKLVTCR